MEAIELDSPYLETQCYLCGGPLVDGECPAYNWHDRVHLENREKMKAGLSPTPVEPHVIPARDDWGPCWVCGAETDPEGRCTRVNEFFHEDAHSSWMNLFHSRYEMESAPPAAFLIEGFLQQDAITALAAPVGQRKSLISLNVAHALCTGEPLFDYFKVTIQPSRVLYLCPEMGLRSFNERVRKIGLLPYVGKTLFCRTMSAEGTLALDGLPAEALKSAVVIIDTAVRYLKGDENSSEHMRVFAEEVFRLMCDGAASVLLLHHSAKGTKESSELTLENAMRGSGELGAFVSSCWATRLQQPDEPYKSASYLVNVKQRDFESQPFEVTSGPDCRLHIVDKPGDHIVLNSKPVGPQPDKDGKRGSGYRAVES
jgi:AAA domain